MSPLNSRVTIGQITSQNLRSSRAPPPSGGTDRPCDCTWVTRNSAGDVLTPFMAQGSQQVGGIVITWIARKCDQAKTVVSILPKSQLFL